MKPRSLTLYLPSLNPSPRVLVSDSSHRGSERIVLPWSQKSFACKWRRTSDACSSGGETARSPCGGEEECCLLRGISSGAALMMRIVATETKLDRMTITGVVKLVLCTAHPPLISVVVACDSAVAVTILPQCRRRNMKDRVVKLQRIRDSRIRFYCQGVPFSHLHTETYFR